MIERSGRQPGTGTAIRAVLQAGGRGQRLQPATANVPKPLLPVAGTPMVERLLRQIVRAGVTDITVITGWLGHKIRSHLESLSDLPEGVTLRFFQEEIPLGNIGALAELELSGTSLFAFADLVTDMRFEDLIKVHREGGAAATLASHHETYQVSLGEMVLENDRVVAYREKPLKSYTICSGVAAFEPEVLGVLKRGQPMGISDLITRALAAGYRIGHWPHGAHFLDVNQPEALKRANVLSWLVDR